MENKSDKYSVRSTGVKMMKTKVVRDASYLLPPPGGEVVRDLLDKYDALLIHHNELVDTMRWWIECSEGFDNNGWSFWLNEDATFELTETCNSAWLKVLLTLNTN